MLQFWTCSLFPLFLCFAACPVNTSLDRPLYLKHVAHLTQVTVLSCAHFFSSSSDLFPWHTLDGLTVRDCLKAKKTRFYICIGVYINPRIVNFPDYPSLIPTVKITLCSGIKGPRSQQDQGLHNYSGLFSLSCWSQSPTLASVYLVLVIGMAISCIPWYPENNQRCAIDPNSAGPPHQNLVLDRLVYRIFGDDSAVFRTSYVFIEWYHDLARAPTCPIRSSQRSVYLFLWSTIFVPSSIMLSITMTCTTSSLRLHQAKSEFMVTATFIRSNLCHRSRFNGKISWDSSLWFLFGASSEILRQPSQNSCC